MGSHLFGESARGLAFVEFTGAVLRDPLESMSQFRLDEQVAGLVERAALLKDTSRFGIFRQTLPIAERLRAHVGDPMALGCESDCGLKQFRPGSGSESAMRKLEAADIARHGGRAPAGHTIWRKAAVRLEEHVARRLTRRTLAEVEEAGPAVLEANQDVAAAAQAVHA